MIMKYIYLIAVILLLGLVACSQTIPVNENGGRTITVPVSKTYQDGDLEVIVGPMYDEVSDSFNVEITSVPENTNQILLFIKPLNMPVSDNPFTAPNTIVKFLDPVPVKLSIDTLIVENGDYELSVGASSSSGGVWLGEIKTEFKISN